MSLYAILAIWLGMLQAPYLGHVPPRAIPQPAPLKD